MTGARNTKGIPIMKKATLGAIGLAGLLAGSAVVADQSSAADHLEAPLVQADGRTDINDVYAFSRGDMTALIMTVNPAAGILSPTTFDPDGVYRFQIDNDGDFKKEETITVKFGEPNAWGEQRIKIEGAGGTGQTRGWTGETISLSSGGQAMAGTFDDPFFFDFEAFLGTVKGQGTRSFCDGNEVDFFAPTSGTAFNISGIVIEVPSSMLTDDSSTINVWGETENASGRADRVGKPAISTVLINDGNEDAFNHNRPHSDVRRWSDEVSANLQFLSGLDGDGYDEATADFVTSLLLPDVLTLDTSSGAGFVDGPLNGRQPAEDVIDFELAVVTGLFDAGGNGPVLTTDCVDANNVAFPSGFPYLAPENS
jgi:hypothetical protein